MAFVAGTSLLMAFLNVMAILNLLLECAPQGSQNYLLVPRVVSQRGAIEKSIEIMNHVLNFDFK